jgi:hemolysin activation/secretion protein
MKQFKKEIQGMSKGLRSVCSRGRHGQRLSQVGVAGVLMLSLLVAERSIAQSGAPAMPASTTPTFAIKGFKITGENPLDESITSKVLAPFLRSDATIDTLQKATAALETALREKGFGLHRVALPPQEVGETVNLSIVKFAINKVSIEGLSRYDEANIRRSLPELKEGQTPNFSTLAVQTAIANESQGKQVTVSLKESDEPDKIDSNIQVKEGKPWNFSVNWANNGNASSGKDRLTVSGGHSNLFDRDQQIIGAYTTSVSRTNDVKQIGLSYRAPLYVLGGVVGVSYTQSDVLGNFGAFTSTGAGKTYGVNYTAYLPPDGGYRSYVTVGLDDKLFNGAVINGVKTTLDTRTRPLSLGYNAKVETDGALWGYNTELAVNLGGGNGNDLNAYTNAGTNLIYDTNRFKILRGGGNYSSVLGKNWFWSARGLVQYTPNTLIAGEAFGLGGSSSVRGTGERVISGDKGVFTSLELSSPEVAEGLRFTGFVDAGWLYNNNNTVAAANPARPASDKLASVGLGMRFARQSGLAISADYAQVVTGSMVPITINSSAPKKGDSKLHVNLSVRF